MLDGIRDVGSLLLSLPVLPRTGSDGVLTKERLFPKYTLEADATTADRSICCL